MTNQFNITYRKASQPTLLFFVITILLSVAVSGLGQESRTQAYFETLAQARARITAREWKPAAELLEKLVVMNPLDGQSWVHLGSVYYRTGEYRRSISAYQKSLELGFGRVGDNAYNVACNYALLGEKEQALKWLEKAFQLKFLNLEKAATDSDLTLIRDDSRYKRLVGLIDSDKMSRTEGWRYDLYFLSREIKRLGYHLFSRIGTEADFDAEIKKVSDAIPQLTDAEISVEFMKILRRVGDGHSTLIGSTSRPEWTQTLPVQFYLFEEGLFIISADPKYRGLLGAQVVRFGNNTIDQVVQKLDSVISRDNAIWVRLMAPYRMRNLPLLNALGLVPDPNRVTLTVRGMDGREREVSLSTDSTQPNIWNSLPNPSGWVNLPQTLAAPMPLYLKDPTTRYRYDYLPENKTVYFQFNRVVNDNKESFSAFCERLFKFIDENDVQKLVIDLRWNNGGHTFLLPPLIEGIIKRDKINRSNRLFVIIGRRVYSAAQNAATFLERHTKATFVGEPTGSNPNFVGESHPFLLPYSKLSANVSEQYHESSYPEDQRPWIAPNIYVPPTFAAYRVNRDTALEEILSYKQ